jgi:hypothetical protein
MRKVLLAGAASLAGVRLLVMAAAACLVLASGFAVMSAGAHSPRSRTVANVDGSNATACSKETVSDFGKPTTLRFVLHGVSCSKAHALIRTYFRTATTQSCRNHGTVCILDFPGGWSCSFIIATEGPGLAGCVRSQSERFKVFRVTRHTRGSPHHLAEFLSPDRKIWCVLSNHPGVREADCFYAANRFTGGQEYSASLHPDGQLGTCAWQPSQSGLEACVQNWDASARVLKRGQVDVIYQYRCRATSTAITCTVDTGTGKGKGFTISDTGVTPIP